MQKKEIKDAYPKKICHMLKRHVKKEREREKDAYPKKIRHMPASHVKKKKKKEKRKEKDSLHPWKIKKREGSCKGVHPPSTKNSYTLAHLDQIV